MKPADKKIITLIGMMGVGKTTIGAKLAKKLGIYFVDSDQEIEDSNQSSTYDIFEKNGEEYFRNLEKETIENIIARDEPMVLSLGGGSIINIKTRDLVKDKTISIWLNADIETILYRISGKNTRPLLKNGNKRNIIENLIKDRTSSYQECDIEIDTNHKNHEETINNIVNKIKLLIKENDK